MHSTIVPLLKRTNPAAQLSLLCGYQRYLLCPGSGTIFISSARQKYVKVMDISRSNDYYYSSGNVVIQVETCLYRLHRDILEGHSGFFKDMFLTPSSDTSEGSFDEHPLHIPHELCSDATFNTLCQFIYPKKSAIVPNVSHNDFSTWEPVLEAAFALDMTGIQEYILDRLADNPTSNPHPSGPLKMLHWAARTSHDGLMLEGLRTLSWRRLPILPSEIQVLGDSLAARAMYIRERARTGLLSQQLSWVEEDIHPHNLCSTRDACRVKIFKSITRNLTISPKELPSNDVTDVFQLPEPGSSYGPCSRCQSIRSDISRSIRRGKVDQRLFDKSLLEFARAWPSL
ncbi:unnamed protein product [Rhizoctonia solani]|uniref:BTB domain-containing protein n=1 Tax=Rhizoctonia solani TaxID=456999 RepID=A0A8H3I2Y3_9AGAM|nr:unnamed protein product [Rhizoctonia solani]